MTNPRKDLSSAFADFARDLLDKESVQSTLEEIAQLAVSEIDGCEFAGISVLHPGGSITTAASTHPVVGEADQLQYTTRQGPCLEAISDRKVYFIHDTLAEPRWPDFVEGVAGLGMRGMMSAQLFTRREVLGGLNLYSTETGAFDEGSARVGEILAAHAAVALSSAQNDESLRDAIRTRERIGEATGILMERYKLTSQQAFALLAKASQNLNTKLRDLAEEIVHTGDFPRKSV
ncbi:GAF and ANTAR domain-containing protein [Nocardiopsis oceani]